MKSRIFFPAVLLWGLLSPIWAFSQEDSPLTYFREISGAWEAIPKDSSFISQLEYIPGEQKYFVGVTNTLLSKERKPFSYYEGTYFLNPTRQLLEFRTINASEMHAGDCKVSGDTLFHYATLSGKSKTKSYTSAIVKQGNHTLLYFAAYSTSGEMPALKFENPLIYHRLQPKNQEMEKVTGIGGIFFKSKDPDKAKEWYKKHLGLNANEFGTNSDGRPDAQPSKRGSTLWYPIQENSNNFEPSSKDFMINFCVKNLEILVETLQQEGVEMVDKIEVSEFGKFVHILDWEGIKIELWEPNDKACHTLLKSQKK